MMMMVERIGDKERERERELMEREEWAHGGFCTE